MSRASFLTCIRQLFKPEKPDRKKLLQYLRDAQQAGVIDMDALAMIEGVFQVSEMRVRDIMIPRSLMITVQKDMEVEDMLPIVTSSGHSRFPVENENRDEIIGILLAKDLSHYADEQSRQNFELKDIMRTAVFVPESKRLNVLLKDFRNSRNHMAIVIDEYSAVSGLVTIEDVLEQIVGEIDDEHDMADVVNIRREGYRRFSIRGVTPIGEFNQYFGTHFHHEKFDTIAGLVTHQLGHLPERGEEVTLENMHFKVLSANSRRVNSLQVSLLADDDSASDSNASGAA